MTKKKQTLALAVLEAGYTLRTTKEALIIVHVRHSHRLDEIASILETCKVVHKLSEEDSEMHIAIFIK